VTRIFLSFRIEKLAEDVLRESLSPSLVLLCVLKGGHQFFADLISAIKRQNVGRSASLQLCLEFIKVKSYVNDQSTGNVQISGLDAETLKGKVRRLPPCIVVVNDKMVWHIVRL
jgi:hypoxanthine phosphoribosyltransferase